MPLTTIVLAVAVLVMAVFQFLGMGMLSRRIAREEAQRLILSKLVLRHHDELQEIANLADEE